MGEGYIGVKFKTIFEGEFKPSSSEKKKIEEMIKVGKDLSKMGFEDENGGNFSARTKNGIIIKTTGSFPHELTEDDFSLVTGFKNDDVYVYGKKEPSSEARLHWGIYEQRSDVNYVLHTHDFIAVNCPVKMDKVAYVKEYPYGTMESANAIKKASKDSDYLVMESHGVIAFAKNISSALKLIQKKHEKFKSIKENSPSDCRIEKG